MVKPAGNFLLYSAKAVEPPGRGFLRIIRYFSELSRRLGFRAEFTQKQIGKRSGWIFLLDQSDIPDKQEFKKKRDLYGRGPGTETPFRIFIRDPQKHPLQTPSGKVEIAPESWEDLGYKAPPP